MTGGPPSVYQKEGSAPIRRSVEREAWNGGDGVRNADWGLLPFRSDPLAAQRLCRCEGEASFLAIFVEARQAVEAIQGPSPLPPPGMIPSKAAAILGGLGDSAPDSLALARRRAVSRNIQNKWAPSPTTEQRLERAKEPFHDLVQFHPENRLSVAVDCLHLSVTTIVTLGYSDIAPRTWYARLAAVAEAFAERRVESLPRTVEVYALAGGLPDHASVARQLSASADRVAQVFGSAAGIVA